MLKVIKADEFKRTPPMMLIYGQEGIGKTSFAATMNTPIFVKTEEGFPKGVKCDSFELCKTFDNVIEDLEALLKEEHEYKTVVLDYLDGVEYLLHKEILEKSRADSMETACGGYGKAYGIVNNKMNNKLLPLLISLRDVKKMWVVILAHASVVEKTDPMDGKYQYYSPAFAHKGWDEMFRNSCDCVFFATGRFTNTNFGNSTNIRVFKCQPTKTFTAKNRFSSDSEIEMDYKSLVSAFKN